MANTFKNTLEVTVGTVDRLLYTCPAGKKTLIVGLNLANISTTDTVKATVKITDTSAARTAYLVRNAPVSLGGSLVAIGAQQKMVLEAGDTLTIASDVNASLDATLSVIEMD